jgi:hypothetical protein
MEEDLDKLLEDTKQETTIDGKFLPSGGQQDAVQTEQPVNTVSTATIENYLKDLMELSQVSTADNSELLNRIDQVSNSIEGCINLAESNLRKIKSKASFKKTTRKKKTYDYEYVEFINPWASSTSELEQDQTFIDYLDKLDGPISEDELAEWSNDIDLFMEGLSNPDKTRSLMGTI